MFEQGVGVETSGATRRVGIVTLHYGYNEGAILQAYCTAALIREILPEALVEIVDQRYAAKCAVQGPPRTARTAALQKAIDEWLPLSDHRFCSDSHTEAFEHIRRSYDVVVAGSDVLWKVKYRRRLGGLLALQKYPFFTPFPNLYWPDETIKLPKIAFAASIGTTNWKEIPRRHCRRMAAILREFTAISVRDARTARFLAWLDPELGRRAERLADPTFGYDVLSQVDRALLKQRLVDSGVDFDRPRCGFIAASTAVARDTAAALRKRGYQVVGIGTANDFSDVRLFEHGFHPAEWAALFGFMDFCVSERMHACIFCLLNQTPFVALDINESSGDPQTKLNDLLGHFGVADYCFPMSTASAAAVVEACGAIVAQRWNWDGIRQRIESFRRETRDFARRSVGTTGLQPCVG